MRIIHGSGFSESEKNGLIPLIYYNIVTNAKDMIDAMEKLSIDYENTETKVNSHLQL